MPDPVEIIARTTAAAAAALYGQPPPPPPAAPAPAPQPAPPDQSEKVRQLELLIRRLEEDVKLLRGRVEHAEAKQAEVDHPMGRVFLALPGPAGVGPNPNLGTWSEVTAVNGELVEFEDGRKCDDPEDDSALLYPQGSIPVMEFDDAGRKSFVPLFNFFRVLLTQDGGGDGGLSNPADYTYTVLPDGGGDPLGYRVTPEMPARPNGKRTVATFGWAYYQQDGSVALAICNEVENTSGC